MIFLGDWILKEGANVNLLQTNDLKIVNLECVVSSVSVPKSDKAHPIILNKSAISLLKKTRNIIVDVANNHTYDAGEEEFLAFLEILDNLSIPYYGTVSKPFIEVYDNGNKYILVGGLSNSRSRGKQHIPIEKITSIIKCNKKANTFIIVTPHWGGEGEYTPYPSPMQRSLAVEWVIAGADAIFGHHSHSIQSFESFNGKPIFYSLGNFHFPHKESSMYSITRFGLGIDYCSGMVKNLIFFAHESGSTRIVHEESKIYILQEYISRISNDVNSQPWTLWRWATAIGLRYTEKNAASWRLRYKKRPVVTIIKWSVAQLMPFALLLRIGCIFSNVELRSRYEILSKIE